MKHTLDLIVRIIGGISLVAVMAWGGYMLGQKASIADTVDLETPIVIKKDHSQDTKTKIIEWSTPELIEINDIFDPAVYEWAKRLNQNIEVYKVGKLISGIYQNGLLYRVKGICDGPCMLMPEFRIISKENKYFILTKHSDSLDTMTMDVNGKKIVSGKNTTLDETFTIQEILFPDEIKDTGYDFVLKRVQNSSPIWEQEKYQKLWIHPMYGDVYSDQTGSNQFGSIPTLGSKNNAENGFYIKSPDGSRITYEPKYNWWENDIPNFTFTDNKNKNTNEYNMKDLGGCGWVNTLSIVENIYSGERNGKPEFTMLSEAILKERGKNAQGTVIYAFTDSNHPYLKKYYNDTYIPSYTGNEQKISYEEFLSKNPLLFWKDSFNRWVKIYAKEITPQVECGKPVIYLYPKKTQDISVQVAPQGGFSLTIPEYNNGWFVSADTQSNIYDYNTKTMYPYLFWEGKGGLYKKPAYGWVVKQREVEGFLKKTLEKYQLNQKEIDDFLEFWLPKMQKKPYYFISFYGTQTMNTIAPMTITPKPDTIIRILMDYEGLDHPIEVDPYEIQAPVRKGFTVIEWGGVLGRE